MTHPRIRLFSHSHTTSDAPAKNSRSYFLTLLCCMALPIYLELMLHLLIYSELSFRSLYSVCFAGSVGCLLFALCALLPPKGARWALPILVSALCLFFEIQLVYHSIFDEFMPLWQISFGADAVTNFWRPMLYGIAQVWWQILLMLVPIPLSIILCKKLSLFNNRRIARWFLSGVAYMLLLSFGLVGFMRLTDTGISSMYQFYSDPNCSTEISMKNLGLFLTVHQEGRFLLLPEQATETEDSDYTYYTESSSDEPEDEILSESSAEEDTQDASLTTDEEQPEEAEEASKKEAKPKANILPINFNALIESADSKTLKNLDSYFAEQKPTYQNEYTGLLKGYNLIALCCESFSPKLIDPERTPALYKLSTNGFVFKNFFGSFASNTTNGEYTFCMGILPDTSRSKSAGSFYASRENYLPFCLGNAFANAGAETWAYHNYSGDYYTRNLTHPNMGFTFQSADDGLDMALGWPTSDLEMMENSIEDYIHSGKQFCAYYMTFSGHYQYNWDNPMCRKNRETVSSLPYSSTVQAYISCNLELEYALEYLMEKLEEAGIADKTAIVLTNDHFPYGLSEWQYNELAGEDIDTTFERFRNSFICYVPDLKIPIDTYCSTIDILPTVLNLFDLPYDSRLLMGKDVLSPQAENLAVLSDTSFITPEYGYDASTGRVKAFTDTEPDDEIVKQAIKKVKTKFQVSTDILNSDYYAHAIQGVIEIPDNTTTYFYTDIPTDYNIESLDFVRKNKYMEPISSTKFGFETICTNLEYLRIICAMAGCEKHSTLTETELLIWAKGHGLLSVSELSAFKADEPVLRNTANLLLYRLAKALAMDTSTKAILHPYDPDRAEATNAAIWCFENSIDPGDGTLASVLLQTENEEMTRLDIVNAVYSFSTIHP